MKISRKKGAKKCCLKPSINRGRGWYFCFSGTYPPTGFLQMDSLWKDFELFLLAWPGQRTQLIFSLLKFLLLKMFLVPNLSFNSSQKNTSCLYWQEVFQNNLKAGWIVACPVKTLYAFEEENVFSWDNWISLRVSASCIGRKATFETGMLKNSEKEAEFLAVAADKSVRFCKWGSSGYCNFGMCGVLKLAASIHFPYWKPDTKWQELAQARTYTSRSSRDLRWRDTDEWWLMTAEAANSSLLFPGLINAPNHPQVSNHL